MEPPLSVKGSPNAFCQPAGIGEVGARVGAGGCVATGVGPLVTGVEACVVEVGVPRLDTAVCAVEMAVLVPEGARCVVFAKGLAWDV